MTSGTVQAGVPRVAVIGCGYWGSNHARTLAGLGALIAVADHHPDRAEALAATLGVKAMAAADIYGDRTIDAVVLALPPQAHAENALRAIEAGKHVLVEKPIALDVADGERIVAAARDRGVVAMTGHVLRFHPAFERLLQIVRSGELGEIRYVHSHRVGLGKFHTENDALWDIAPHDISLILAVTGEAPSAIRGEGAATLDHLSDFAHLHLEFPSGVKGHVFTSRLNPYRERRLSVIGSRAMAVFDDVAPWPQKLALYRHKVWQGAGGIEFEAAEPEFIAVPEEMPLTRECAHFLACITAGTTPVSDIGEGLEVLRILEAGTVRHDREGSERRLAMG
jgi:predicted dehydrogenase